MDYIIILAGLKYPVCGTHVHEALEKLGALRPVQALHRGTGPCRLCPEPPPPPQATERRLDGVEILIPAPEPEPTIAPFPALESAEAISESDPVPDPAPPVRKSPARVIRSTWN